MEILNMDTKSPRTTRHITKLHITNLIDIILKVRKWAKKYKFFFKHMDDIQFTLIAYNNPRPLHNTQRICSTREGEGFDARPCILYDSTKLIKIMDSWKIENLFHGNKCKQGSQMLSSLKSIKINLPSPKNMVMCHETIRTGFIIKYQVAKP